MRADHNSKTTAASKSKLGGIIALGHLMWLFGISTPEVKVQGLQGPNIKMYGAAHKSRTTAASEHKLGWLIASEPMICVLGISTPEVKVQGL